MRSTLFGHLSNVNTSVSGTLFHTYLACELIFRLENIRMYNIASFGIIHHWNEQLKFRVHTLHMSIPDPKLTTKDKHLNSTWHKTLIARQKIALRSPLRRHTLGKRVFQKGIARLYEMCIQLQVLSALNTFSLTNTKSQMKMRQPSRV